MKNIRSENALNERQEGRSRWKGAYKDIPNRDGLEIRFSSLVDRVRTRLRILHYDYRTEQTYLEWICRFLNFNGLKDPEELGAGDVKVYLEY